MTKPGPEANEILGSPSSHDTSVIGVVQGIITGREFDYFASASEARAYAEAEGVDLDELTQTGGEDGDEYTKVPRRYSEGLNFDLVSASVALGVRDLSSVFLHADRYTITLGRTRPNYMRRERGSAAFVAPADRRSVGIRVLSPDYVQYSLQPRQEAGSFSAFSFGSVDLSLGRDIVVGGADTPEGTERAKRDIFRDWESVLVIGSEAVGGFIEETLAAAADDNGPRSELVANGLATVASSDVLEG